jgi:ABC-type nickel/cobalt efflux system permease component RcnA
MHFESLTILAKSAIVGVGIVVAATADRLPAIIAQADAADISGWFKIIGEYGVLVSLAIYFLWRDWKREQQAETKAKQALDLAHDRELATIEAGKDRDSAQFKSREAREQAMKEQWMHSERRREELEKKIIAIIEHFLRQRDKQISITDTDRFDPVKPD